MSFILVAIAVIVVVFIGVFYYSKRKASPSVDQSDKEAEIVTPEDDLLKLNLRLRKSAADVNVTSKCEQVIDQLIDLIPAIESSALPGTEMAWTVNQIAKEYLPNKCMGPYLNLNPAARKEPEKIETVMSNLEILSSELTDVEKLLNNRDESEFNKKATFLKHRFNQNGEA